MSREDQNADDTFGTVKGRHQKWSEANPRRRGPSAIKVPEMSDAVEKTLGMAAGFGAGALLLLLAAVTATAAASWARVDRSGAAVAYSIATFFLILAGLGALAATYNHVFRIIPGEAPEHH
ncbi:MAG TPA: hypothetical protein VGC13_31915 [Longimicrobium sp.]|jgi:hypothetical protein|uniref:hypothetical protein n=1 Tax=Longimicrobium sp. TaxID=2029185 RepID=UPI002EDACC02